MKALVHEAHAGFDGVAVRDIEEAQVKPGFVKIRLKAAGLNHRDIFILSRHSTEDEGLIVGSDGAGVVEEVGDGVSRFTVGQEVIINPGIGWEEESDAPPEGFEILGLPDHGTIAESIVVPESTLELKPPHLSFLEAGTLSLAALTAYRALVTRAKLQSSQTILLPGVGSGAVTFLLLFAKKIGARVIVTSRSKEKREQALSLGADAAIDSEGDWDHQLEGEKVDVVIESVGAATFHKSLGQLRKGGTLVMFGASAGDEVTFNLRDFFYGQFNLLGSTMGSHEEYRAMLSFISKHNIKPVVDRVFPLSKAKEALQYLERGEQLGKVAINIDTDES
ncbi:zinc-binding dehydrogenase [Paenalkalicoccus suaedae]|uniref:Zinc-binding dehydrogenase n=1 Tax=Paenalkalicoccus suaedae TaxID=2592382 RepID=A0A859FKE9_9BACI|nr:zinc-binding dehydrogenase [Paenalkalicoccus suaedae]QKS73264.1 zinc-binding dehydrogenase [Paenalkalicoccus suaedae]